MNNFIKKFPYQTLSDLHNSFDNIETPAQFIELINTIDYSTCLERAYENHCWDPQYNIKQDFYNIQKRIVALMPRLEFCSRWYYETKRILELKMCPDEKYYEGFVQFLLNIIYKEIIHPMLASPDTDVYKPIAHEIIKKYDSTNPKRLIKYIAVCIQNEKNTMDKKELQLNQQNNYNYHNDTYNNGDTVTNNNYSNSNNCNNNYSNSTINYNYYTTPVEKSTCENKGTENNPSKDDLPC